MKKLMGLVAFAALASGLSGCAGLAFMQRGIAGHGGELYADTQANEKVTDNPIAAGKRGEACAASILGIVTTGDASVASAAAAGGITRVATVDNKFSNILGLYAKYCVVVQGE